MASGGRFRCSPRIEVCAGGLIVGLCLVASSRGAGAEDGERRAAPAVPVRIALIGPSAEDSAARAVIGEWLAREGMAVSWSFPSRFLVEHLFAPAQDIAIEAWIDLSSPEQVHLYFRDATSKWFVIRAVRLANGLDEVGREQIGHVVSSAVIALAAGAEGALHEEGARMALHALPPPSVVVATPPRDGKPGLRLELAGLGCVQIHARDKPTTEAVALSLTLARGPRWGPGRGSPGAWLGLRYQIPVTSQAGPVSVDLSTVSLRSGLLWEVRGLRAVSFRLALGGGVDRVQYQPAGDTTVLALAPASHFWLPMASLWAGCEVRLVEHVGLDIRVFADLAMARVHYDVDDPGGSQVEALTPYRLRPGLALGTAFPF